MAKILPALLIIIILAGVGYFLISSGTTNNYIPQLTGEPAPEADYSDEPVEQGAKNLVIITSAGYEPATITIKAGEEVVWTNNSGTNATVNSATHPTHEEYAQLNSVGDIATGESESLVFEEPGTYQYHNHLNASQMGTVVVK